MRQWDSDTACTVRHTMLRAPSWPFEMALWTGPLAVAVAAGDTLPLAVNIELEPAVLVGDIPQVRAVLRNVSDAPQVVVRPLDGSLSAWRYPVLTLEVRRLIGEQNAGDAVKLQPGPRCGNMNALRATDIATLEPGGATEAYHVGWVGA